MENTPFQIRYYFEHNFLPQTLYSEKGKQFLYTLLEKKEKLFIELMNLLGSEDQLPCPYQESDYDIKAKVVEAKEDLPSFVILTVALPKPEGVPLCSCLYICHDIQFGNIRYYTVEQSFENKFVLSGWDEQGSHINFGEAPEEEDDRFLKISELYSGFLREHPLQST